MSTRIKGVGTVVAGESVCCILGAGYSFVAGFPLTAQLFEQSTHVASRAAQARFERVWRDYDSWREQNVDGNAEEYLRDLYLGDRGAFAPPFAWAVELIGAVLSTPREQDSELVNPRYAVRLTRPLRCGVHEAFWTGIIARFEAVCAVTTNYDICIERCLRHRHMARSSMPGFFYGGLPLPQTAKGVALPWRPENRMRAVSLTGSVPLLKIHGSLNWVVQNGIVGVYQDTRAAFRRGGDAAIVPPIPEKEIPIWLQPVWSEAERCLSHAGCWVICGYSLPSYDTAMRQMLSRAGADGKKKLFILDPVSGRLASRWNEVSPHSEVVGLGGLPEGVSELMKRTGNAP
jgi:hypothetical protein